MRDNGSGAGAEDWTKRFVQHPMREAVLGELHARPFHALVTPRTVIHYAFMSTAETAAEDRARLAARCEARGLPKPGPNTRHMVLKLGEAALRWETHAEFTTYSFDMPPPKDGVDPLPALFGKDFQPPGPLIVACRLELVHDDVPLKERLAGFDPASLAVSLVAGGRALIATDFKPNDHGRTDILVVDTGMFPQEPGSTAQRLLEIETYRTMALLGLPETQRLTPVIRRIESELSSITERIRMSSDLEQNRHLLADLTGLAADLEAATATTGYRFGASRAYFEIVRARLDVIDEKALDGYVTWSVFLNRRLLPAMRTIQATDSGQSELAAKLARAAELLRTRVDVELERQNKALLETMNRRGRIQLRMQQTVEGLSVAAISYYVIGLVSYLAKTVTFINHSVDPEAVTAAAVLPVVLLVWLMVRRIRRAFEGPGHAEE
ncbi:MAG: DUF3422 domain-containing protein [Bauldia sp.]|nr:DUF3422 domain-containing protein [Bauldia sp.]